MHEDAVCGLEEGPGHEEDLPDTSGQPIQTICGQIQAFLFGAGGGLHEAQVAPHEMGDEDGGPKECIAVGRGYRTGESLTIFPEAFIQQAVVCLVISRISR